MKKRNSILVVRGSQVVQELLLWAVLVVRSPGGIRVIARRATRRNLRESHRGKIPVTPSPYLGLLVVGDAEGSSRVC